MGGEANSDRTQPAQAIGLRAWCVGLLVEWQTGLSQQDTTMSLFSRRTRRSSSPKPTTSKPRLEPLESRQLLSGFGPEDGAYILEPWIGSYSKVQIQPGDQKIVAAGQVNPSNDYSDQRMAIVRYDSLGNIDSTYGSGGVSTPALGSGNESGRNIVIQPDGKAVVSGQSQTGMSPGDSAFAVARFHTNGTLDTSFGNGGWNSLNLPARGFDFNLSTEVGLQSSGKIVVAGSSLGSSGAPTLAEVARFTAGGAVDSGKGAFGQVTKGKAVGYTLTSLGMDEAGFSDLAVQPDDKLVAVGSAYTTDATSGRLAVARYTASGTLDKTFNGTGYTLFLPAGISNARAVGVALQSNGKIVVTGFCTGTDGADDLLIARFNTNGTLDTSFGGGSGYVRLDNAATNPSREIGRDVAIQPDGKIVVGGVSSVAESQVVLVARFNADGTPDATFAPGGYKIGAPLPDTGYHSFDAVGIALQPDGSIIVAGSDDQDSTNTSVFHPFLMRFFPTSTSSLQAADGAALAASHTQALGLARVKPQQAIAIARLHATGVDVLGLGSLDATMTNLPDATIGLDPANISLGDSNAIGWGWLVGRSSRRGRIPQGTWMGRRSALTTK